MYSTFKKDIELLSVGNTEIGVEGALLFAVDLVNSKTTVDSASAVIVTPSKPVVNPSYSAFTEYSLTRILSIRNIDLQYILY